MLYDLFDLLNRRYDIPGAGMFQYISFRAAMAIILALLITITFGYPIIRFMRRHQMGDDVRNLGLEGQLQKRGTPTMGGLIILLAIIAPVLLFGRLDNIYVQMMLIATVWLGGLGFLDDYIKVFRHNKEGLKGKFKIVGQVGIGIIVGTVMCASPQVVIREKVPAAVAAQAASGAAERSAAAEHPEEALATAGRNAGQPATSPHAATPAADAPQTANGNTRHAATAAAPRTDGATAAGSSSPQAAGTLPAAAEAAAAGQPGGSPAPEPSATTAPTPRPAVTPPGYATAPGAGLSVVEQKTTKTTIPFVKNNEFDYDWLTGGNKTATWVVYVLIAIFIVTAVSNGANLTDGLDGLAAGVSVPIAAVLGILAYLSGHIVYADYLNIMYIPGSGELVVFAAAFVGALVGFLWYNSFPAQTFMGDTGSLAIGGIIAVFALCIRKELLLPILCGIFLIESASVMVQVSYFKYTKRKYGEGRRLLLMSPIHHHYQKKGLFETKIVTRFWIVSLLLALTALATLKIR